MVQSPGKIYSSKSTSAGLTLIEVLIALAIVGIAMLAVIKAVSQNIRATQHLQQKTIALWLGQSVLNQARASVSAANRGSGDQATTTMLGQDWYWQLASEETPNPRITKLKVKVFMSESDQEAESPILTLEGYRYLQDQGNA
jgi:general secretion pathway protein I